MLPAVKSRFNMPSFFEDFFGKDLMPDLFEDRANMSVPAVNVLEDADNFKIELAAPGMEKKDFKIDLENNVLTISSEKEYKHEDEKDGKFMRREFGYASFKRSFTLPESVDADKIKANYKDGLLHINIPKREEAKQKPPKQISIS